MRVTPWLLSLALLTACGGAADDFSQGTSAPPGDDAGDVRRDDAGATTPDAGDTDAGTTSQPDAGEPDAGATTPDAGVPSVRFVSPANGATVDNPVTFTIAAEHVDEVQIFADGTWPLAPAWNPATRSTLRYRFSGTGTPRALSVAGFVGGVEVARSHLTLTVTPDSCADRFFVSTFDSRNTDSTGAVDLAAIREDSLEAVKAQLQALSACGATVTAGGMMSLLLYEGGLWVAAFNTRCSENSYNRTSSDCDLVAEALYSYQFGLGAIHTSNFHPCKGGNWTQTMRQRFLDEAQAAGFDVSPSLVTPALAARFHTVCPNATPSAVDYYLLSAHDVFGIPRNAGGNHLAGYGAFPLFSPRVSIALSFRELIASCASVHSDRDAITRFGGSDTSYATASKQNAILAAWQNYSSANCP